MIITSDVVNLAEKQEEEKRSHVKLQMEEFAEKKGKRRAKTSVVVKDLDAAVFSQIVTFINLFDLANEFGVMVDINLGSW